jgi:beta-mannosidase
MSRELRHGWRLACTPAGAIDHPDDLSTDTSAWREALVPGAVAASLGDHTHLPGAREHLGAVDAWDTDWWFCTTLALPDGGDGHVLRFDGLATLATVWIDGREVAHHTTAMRALDIVLDAMPAGDHDLVVVCRGLSSFEAPARPRQRWKTRLVPDARLRWLRTPLFGHMPGWTPPWPVVGPYREVRLLAPGDAELLADGVAWTTDVDGTTRWQVDVAVGDDVHDASISIGTHHAALAVRDGRATGTGAVELARWWPHTHGTPTLHDVTLHLDEREVTVGRIGARTVTVDDHDGGFTLRVNDVPVFARGAVWTPLDAARAWSTPDALRSALTQVRDAGCNMVRVPGIGVPEQPEFHALCDELGLLVWFDLPYANFDHPFDDAAFGAEARREATAQLRTLARHASTAVVCGGSEVHQQAAMYGVAADRRHVPFLEDELSTLVEQTGLHVPVVPSTPWGGGLPFQVDTGVSHYYGIGAYRRPLDDARRADVRFTSECLAFAHVPAAETLDAWTDGELLAPHDPRWKARVPRDRGVGWDFEDVRDHYVRTLGGCDPADLRAVDIARSLDLGRAATAEAVDAATRDLRASSRCGGALVFTLRDPWHGAGWGFIDVTGRPKSAWYVLARRFAARTCWFTDEGPSGLALHVANDIPAALDAEVHVRIVARTGHTIDDAKAHVHVAPHARARLGTTELFTTFHDLTWNYRFGPLEHVAVVATLTATDGIELATDVWMPESALAAAVPEPALAATVTAADDGSRTVHLDLTADTFAPWVHVEVPGWLPSDDWFHLPPGTTRRVTLRPLPTAGAPGTVARLRSLATHRPISVQLAPATAPAGD